VCVWEGEGSAVLEKWGELLMEELNPSSLRRYAIRSMKKTKTVNGMKQHKTTHR